MLTLSVLVAVSIAANGVAMLAGRKPAATDGVRKLNGEPFSEDPRISVRGDTGTSKTVRPRPHNFGWRDIRRRHRNKHGRVGQDVEAVAHADKHQRETNNVLGEEVDDVSSHDYPL